MVRIGGKPYPLSQLIGPATLTSEIWYIEAWYIPDVVSVQMGTLSTTCCNLEWEGVKVLQPNVFTVESVRRNCLCHGGHV